MEGCFAAGDNSAAAGVLPACYCISSCLPWHLHLGFLLPAKEQGCPVQDARANLRALVGLLREFDLQEHGSHTLCADVVELYAATQVWFIPEPGYRVRSTALLVDAPAWHELLHASKCACNRALSCCAAACSLAASWPQYCSGCLQCLLAMSVFLLTVPGAVLACRSACLEFKLRMPKGCWQVCAPRGAGIHLPAPALGSARLCS